MSSMREAKDRSPVALASFDSFAIAAPGVAPLIAAECVALGITPRDVSPAGVSFNATAEQLFTVNLWSRMASRVLVRLAEFEARDFATLEKMATRVPWHLVLSPGAAVRLRVTCRKSRLYHSDAVAERVARGITNSITGSQALGRAKDDEEAVKAEADEAAVKAEARSPWTRRTTTAIRS